MSRIASHTALRATCSRVAVGVLVVGVILLCGCSSPKRLLIDNKSVPDFEMPLTGSGALRELKSEEPLFREEVTADAGESTDERPPSEEPPEQEPATGTETPEQEEVPAPDDMEPGTLDADGIIRMFDDSLVHGDLPADKVRYIVMHDTEAGTGSAAAIIRSWIRNGNLIASHFVVERDGTVYQAVPTDRIAHHAGWSDYGTDEEFGISAERDDRRGYDGDEDYAMNAWSIGIEIVHEHDEGAYPEEQLDAVDRLVAMIDMEVGHQPTIIDHKEWAKSRKQDCSDDFPLEAYKASRSHRGL